MMESSLNMSGAVSTKLMKKEQKAPLSWKLQNTLRREFIWGWLTTKGAGIFSKITGIPTLVGKLEVAHIDGRTGQRTVFGVVSHRLVTVAFVNFMVDQLQTETSEWGDFKFHDSGVGVTAPANTDTDIETTDGEARVTGTQIEGASANIYKSVGTITYTTTKAITEHGLFSIVTGGTLMDRNTFTAINVVNTDQIEFTYELTVNAET